jgi:P27 family predicted phage terminase small subunit
MWGELIKVLGETGVLTMADKNAIAMYCEAYSDWRQAKETIAETGAVLIDDETGRAYKSPYRVILNEAVAQMQSLGASLGLDPSSRSRLKINAGAQKLANDPKAKFFEKREGPRSARLHPGRLPPLPESEPR